MFVTNRYSKVAETPPSTLPCCAHMAVSMTSSAWLQLRWQRPNHNVPEPPATLLGQDNQIPKGEKYFFRINIERISTRRQSTKNKKPRVIFVCFFQPTSSWLRAFFKLLHILFLPPTSSSSFSSSYFIFIIFFHFTSLCSGQSFIQHTTTAAADFALSQ